MSGEAHKNYNKIENLLRGTGWGLGIGVWVWGLGVPLERSGGHQFCFYYGCL